MTAENISAGAPPIVDRDAWLREREALLVREKAHTREADAIAAARRRLPMVEVAPISLDGANGPTPLIDIFQGRDQLVVYKHMFFTGQPADRQCEGCTVLTWGFHDACYLHARGVSFAVFGNGPYEELAQFRAFMGYTHPWYSNYQVDEPAIAGGSGTIACYLRRGDRTYLTYETTSRGVESIASSLKLLDMTVYGRQETWEDSPTGWPQGPTYQFWRTDEHGNLLGLGPNNERPGRPTAQWTRPGATPIRKDTTAPNGSPST
jgi:predicted dithiol-disulfide oxidoreductase (DUF899 family)